MFYITTIFLIEVYPPIIKFMFTTEKQMQQWLRNYLEEAEGLSGLISNAEALKEYIPKDYTETRIVSSFEKVLSSLSHTIKITEDENIASTQGEILRPDFVLYSPGTQSMLVVELKNLVSPSRQAGTELAAYSAGIRKLMPMLAEGDIGHVLISSVWPVILKHYARDQIVWQGRNLLCLRPIRSANGETMLDIIHPMEIAGDELAHRLSPEQLGGYQICLYNYRNKIDLSFHEKQFRAALQYMAIEGNRQRSHGFAYFWRDKADFTLAPYSITCMNVAPFIFPDEILDAERFTATRFFNRLHEVVRDFLPTGHGETLRSISGIGSDFVDNICDPQYEMFATWDQHRMLMHSRAEKIAFIGWGIFGEVYYDQIRNRYHSGTAVEDLMDPDIGDQVVEQLVITRPAVIAALDVIASSQEKHEQENFYCLPPANCDLCEKSLASEKYFIDGKIFGARVWANMCAHCYKLRGEEISWGNGQLYKNCGSNGWLGVAGFDDE